MREATIGQQGRPAKRGRGTRRGSTLPWRPLAWLILLLLALGSLAQQ